MSVRSSRSLYDIYIDFYNKGYHLGLQVLPVTGSVKPVSLAYIRTKQNVANDVILCNYAKDSRFHYMFQNYLIWHEAWKPGGLDVQMYAVKIDKPMGLCQTITMVTWRSTQFLVIRESTYLHIVNYDDLIAQSKM
jgi:hypothetical protein